MFTTGVTAQHKNPGFVGRSICSEAIVVAKSSVADTIARASTG